MEGEQHDRDGDKRLVEDHDEDLDETRVRLFAAQNFSDGARGSGKLDLIRRWLHHPALVRLANGRFKQVIGVRKNTLQDSFSIRLGNSSKPATSAQVLNVDERWLMSPANVSEIWFGFMKGRFFSDNLTAYNGVCVGTAHVGRCPGPVEVQRGDGRVR